MDHPRRFSARVASGRDPRPAILSAIEFARDFLAGTKVDERCGAKVAVIVEELVSNAVRHRGDDQEIGVWLTLEDTGSAVALVIEDDGDPFDPTSDQRSKGPDPQSGGGIGLTIVKAWGEEIAYSRQGDHNRLRMMIR